MATRTPSYVRLADRVALNGSYHDMGPGSSGWGISGFDVVEWPEDEGAAAFAKTCIRNGIMEEASKAEFDEVKDGDIETENPDIAKVAFVTNTKHQEHVVRGNLATASKKLEKRRAAAREQVEADLEGDEGAEDPKKAPARGNRGN